MTVGHVLNDAEQRLARYLAQERYQACRAVGANRGWQPNHDADVEGAAGEIAFARIHNIYPPTDIVHGGEWPTVDCVLQGIPVEVKTCRQQNGRLLVPAGRISKTAHVFALMVGEFPGPYRLAGFMSRSEMLSPQRLCDPGQGKAYAARQSELRAFADIGEAPVVGDKQAHRQDWFRRFKSFACREGELHPYGSPEWCALPDRSWRKIAAAAAAGECWARDGDDLESRVFDEHWLTQEVEAELAAEHNAMVRAIANVSPLLDRPGYIPRRHADGNSSPQPP